MANLLTLPRHVSGELLRIDEYGRQTSQPTLTCVHCGRMWIPVQGSGHVRGWCARCNGPTCGAHACNSCTPWEKRMEAAERRAALHAAMDRASPRGSRGRRG